VAVAFREQAPPGVVDVVPAAETVLVSCDAAASLAAVIERCHAVTVKGSGARGDTLVEVPTRYDGADLADVAAAVGLDVDEVVRLHVEGDYRVTFCGFAPGFGYLTGLDPRLHLPRRATPRTAVPAGSVAIADRFAAVYPRASPGGWHLLGTTDIVLFDPDRTPPALLAPGARVRFVAR
jgi:KipI family sensor histidine kinase inhibitor